MLGELREGWGEFRKHTWLWATVIQYCLVMMAWNGGFMVLGPVVARAHLGGAAAWGAISAADALGLILGGLISLRYTPRKPMLFVVCTGGIFALSPLVLGLIAPLPVICLTAFGLGTIAEVMMVQWTVAMATRIPSDKLARVSSYDAFGSLAAMPLGALVAGPLAASIGVPATQIAAAAVIVVASACTLIPRDIWTIRSDDVVPDSPDAAGRTVPELAAAGAVSGVAAGAPSSAIASAQAGADPG
jgi:MFS family permease